MPAKPLEVAFTLNKMKYIEENRVEYTILCLWENNSHGRDVVNIVMQ